MNSEDHRAQASCRLFVLGLLATVVVAFVLVLGLFHRPFVIRHPIPAVSHAEPR